jgi:phage replication O-like protein O
MANPQLENGFFRIADEIADALMRTNLSAYQSRILWAIFRKTYGFKKKEDWISNTQMIELTGLRKQHICRSIRELLGRNLVTKRGYFIAFNKDYQQWRELPKGVTSHESNQSGLRLYPNGVTKVTKRGTDNRRYLTIDGRDSPNPAVKEFLATWKEGFREKTRKDYFFNGGKEANLAKKMLKAYPIERLKKLAEVFFKSQDKFFQDSGYTIGFFYSQLNKVVIEAEKVKSRWTS